MRNIRMLNNNVERSVSCCAACRTAAAQRHLPPVLAERAQQLRVELGLRLGEQHLHSLQATCRKSYYAQAEALC